jgi:hypothetical protein
MDREDREHFRTMNSASAEHFSGRVNNSARERLPSPLDPAYCQMKAQAICGCYRRDEAQNPETFAAALAIILADYPKDIVDYACDPRTGVITAFPMGLPNIGQIKQFLDDTQNRQARMQHYAALPKPQPRALPARQAGPGDWANVLVHLGAPQYRRMLKATETSDVRKWKHDEQGRGLWVSYDMLHGDNVAKTPPLADLGRKVLERMCKEEGFSPDSPISPALAKNIRDAQEAAE